MGLRLLAVKILVLFLISIVSFSPGASADLRPEFGKTFIHVDRGEDHLVRLYRCYNEFPDMCTPEIRLHGRTSFTQAEIHTTLQRLHQYLMLVNNLKDGIEAFGGCALGIVTGAWVVLPYAVAGACAVGAIGGYVFGDEIESVIHEFYEKGAPPGPVFNFDQFTAISDGLNSEEMVLVEGVDIHDIVSALLMNFPYDPWKSKL